MLTVGALKQLVPLKDIYELDPNSRYLIRMPKGTSYEVLTVIYQQLRDAKVNSLLIVGDDMQFFDLREKVGQ